MRDYLNKFKIPTLLGLAIIFIGLFSGLFLVLREQIFFSQASEEATPQNMNLSNLTENSATISWQTKSPASSFITYGQTSADEETALDDRDTNSRPQPRTTHYVTLRKLLPKTEYQFKIRTGKTYSDIFQFETAQNLTIQSEFTPVIGTVLNGDVPLEDGIVYLSLNGASLQSSLVKIGGNFIIPISQIAKSDLSGAFPLNEDSLVKLTIQSNQGEASAQFRLKTNLEPLSPIRLGDTLEIEPKKNTAPPSVAELDSYDLNEDGKINSADNAIILLNFGTKPKEIRTDLNADGKVDQKDLDLMSGKIERHNTQ